MPENTHTSTSLLLRIRTRDQDGWIQFCSIYGPTVYRWARRTGLQDSDAADIVQDVFQAVANAIDRFQKNKPEDSFRAWLRTITQNKVRDVYRRRRNETQSIGGDGMQMLNEVPTVESEDEIEVPRIKMRALDTIKNTFAENTWQAFWRATVEGDTPKEIAEDLGISVWSVYQAKSRVLRRLRSELDGML